MADETRIDPAPARRRIGKYRVEGLLGEGAMGVVYAGRDPDIDRPVAIKSIHRHLVSGRAAEREDWLARFTREARAAGRCLHPNLVTVFDFLVEDGLPYLVMERLRPATLLDRMAAGPVGLAEIHAILGQVLAGLGAIHAAGVIHRDLKPANVMLAADGTVKLTDFGIARLAATEATGAGLIGTPAYMAPEQMTGGPVDARADIYAAGVLLYELICGRKPFAGAGVMELIQAVQAGGPPPPAQIVADLPPGLDALVLRALARDPQARFADAGDMRAALAALLPAADASGLTAIAPRAGAVSGGLSATMLERISPRTLGRLERQLTSSIGPIGGVLARRAAARAASAEEMVDDLLREIPDPAEQAAARRAIEAALEDDRQAGARGTVAQDRADRLAALLTPLLGPIAPVLVRRAVASGRDEESLLQQLAGHVADPEERARFLRQARAGGG
ncbi:serine/threonine-protein kinase [Mangrovicoccus algicola]|uniref:non-specific serine/threonine protein kinase n=1 Tax=Mangrovicoccus algicola TaxID=2771008 RepID=A0A8J6YYV1_9RHOB|nr:serine/threonine-protein kinase [Mangrovicoccus algicola]MBE3638571.1 serine/threonine protein kinase [Mangrovicoccus algicola]